MGPEVTGWAGSLVMISKKGKVMAAAAVPGTVSKFAERSRGSAVSPNVAAQTR